MLRRRRTDQLGPHASVRAFVLPKRRHAYIAMRSGRRKMIRAIGYIGSPGAQPFADRNFFAFSVR